MRTRLVEVHQASEKHTDIVVVYVPHIINDKKPSNLIAWDSILPNISPVPTRTTVYEYKHAVSAKAPFSQLLEHGASLFCELFEDQLPARQVLKAESPSVYFIGEIFGGIIVKQAIASTIHRPWAWEASLNSIQGIFLVGVPHIESEEHRDRVAPGLHAKTVREDVLPAKVISRICLSSRQFRQVVSELPAEFIVVSAHSTISPKAAFKKFFSRTPVIAPESFVRTGLGSQEMTVAIHSNLTSVWAIEPPSAFICSLRGGIERTQSIKLKRAQIEPTSSTNSQSQGVSNLLSPEQPTPAQTPLSQSPSQTSNGSSFVILTPPASHRSHSPVSARSSSRTSLPPCVNVVLPFCYPESFVDRQRYFRGREEELKLIEEQLLPCGASVGDGCSLRSFCVSGIGGMGKTALAYQYAATHQDAYNVILIVKSDNFHRLRESYCKLAGRLGLLSETGKSSDDECRETLKAWFKRPYQIMASDTSPDPTLQDPEFGMVSWLLIFDNVEQWADLNPYWPDKGRGSVLITTRQPNLLSHIGSFHMVNFLELKPLSKKDAGDVVKHFAGSDQDDSPTFERASQDFVSRLDCLPLAVMQVGAYIRQCKLTIPAFCEAHPKESDMYTVYLDRDRVQDYEHNLGSVWALEASSSGSGSPMQPSALLCVISLLDPEGIKEELLKPDPEGNEVAGYPSNEPELIQHYRTLISASLVEKKTEPKITVHRLVQKVTRAKIATNSVLAGQVFRQVLKGLTSHWPYISRIYQVGTQGNVDRWKTCKKLVPHVSTLSQGYLEFREKNCLNEPSLDLAELLYEVALYFSEKSQPEEASHMLDISEAICASAQGTADLAEYQVRIVRGRIGIAFILRDKEAYFHYAQEELKAETARSNDPSSALAGANLHMGIAYGFNSLWKEAINYLEESMKIRKAMPGFKKDWLFSPYYQLAHAYFHLNDDAKASELLKTAIADRIEALGEHDSYSVRTGALFYTLGDVKTHQGLEEQGFSLHIRAHAHFERTVGPTSRGTLHCKFKMAVHYVRHHSYQIARSYLDDILFHYRIVAYLRRYICRTAWLYAKTLPVQHPDAISMIEEAVQVFNEFSKYEKRTIHTLNEQDAQSLASYDYL